MKKLLSLLLVRKRAPMYVYNGETGAWGNVAFDYTYE